MGTNFYSHAPRGARRELTWDGDTLFIISTHTPLAGRDYAKYNIKTIDVISTHTPLAGRDENRFGMPSIVYKDFYSHAPRGARRFSETKKILLHKFLLTRPSRGATRRRSYISKSNHFYSHAPRGARRYLVLVAHANHWISTHTPLAGRDNELNPMLYDFQNFYSHAPRGARQMAPSSCGSRYHFYSHAPRGARRYRRTAKNRENGFLLTRPSRGATRSLPSRRPGLMISTHTPLAGRDRLAPA